MIKSEKLAIVKSLLGISANDTTKDSELNTLLDIAQEQILNKAFPYNKNVSSVPLRYENLQCRLTVDIYNRKGAEGESEHNENGVNRKYLLDSELLKEVIPMAGVFN